jgi:molecular chaperone GrpE
MFSQSFSPLSFQNSSHDASAETQESQSSDQDLSVDDLDKNGARAEPSESESPAVSLREHLEIKEKLNETTDRMLRIAAEFDNTRKRWDRERQEVRTYAITEFARDLLPVIDAFDKAMETIEKSSQVEGTASSSGDNSQMASLVEGVKLVSRVFLDTLKKHGVERIPAKGEHFNPLFHNAVARVVDGAVKQDTVLDEFAAGYKISDRVLRTAMVRVATPD